MTSSEQRLGIALGIVLLAGGAFIGLTKLKSWKLRVDTHSLEVEARRTEADDLLAQKDFWNERSTWLTEKQPVFTKRSEADISLLTLVDDTANTHSVKVTQKQPQEPSERAGLTSSNILIGATGEMAAVLKWLHELQQPGSFISIPSLTLTPNEEDTSEVIVSMNVQKWFRLPPP